MKFTARLFIAATLLFGAGCAKQDWIERTLVTVDVSGTWSGRTEGTPASRGIVLELEQRGSTVKGLVQVTPSAGMTPGPIQGTVAGDVFRFKDSRGNMDGELTVSGDEMTGLVSLLAGGSQPISLRRVASSSPPAPPSR
jgi:hypothetical protein